ncbi:MAG: UDP-N-acetylglucosamine 2-epimerase (non-hydrolyzing), partial [Myxococcales bacterium]|nr:UDP-N-acetylglucosamine 2-epimerase (non-hydrolyzing) [Myxococcales bacterium]
IKLAPVIRTLAEDPDSFTVRVCATAQHRELLDQVLGFFGVTPDHDLDLMRADQSLYDLTARCLTGLRDVLQTERPDAVCVQGDTTTVFVAALAAAYAHIPVIHVEAGLRSGDREAPFPEEMNRVLTGHLARWHFAPTERARLALAAEGITRDVHVVGNTVIDALLMARALVLGGDAGAIAERFAFLGEGRCVLVTGHRRESFGAPIEQVALGLADVAAAHRDVSFVYPVHPNPHVREPIHRLLGSLPNVHLIEPLDYPYLVWLLERCHVVVTDSGGLQEEAPALGKPVLVTRDVTERAEGVEAGTARLVGTDRARLGGELSRLLDDDEAWRAMARAVNPYGDGHASERIRDILRASGSNAPR